MSDPDQEEMRRKRLARLSAMGGGGGGGPVLGEKDKTNTSPAVMETDTVVVRQTSFDCDSGIETMEVESAEVSCPTKRNRTSSSANYESSPEQILSSLQRVLSVSVPGSEAGTPPGLMSCPQAVSLSTLLSPSDLVGPVLAEITSQQDPAVAVSYLVSSGYCSRRLAERNVQNDKSKSTQPKSTNRRFSL